MAAIEAMLMCARLGLLLAFAAVPANRPALAAELILEKNVVADLLVKGTFDEGGKWHLQRGACYAYLEYPSVSLTNERILLKAHLSSRVGVELAGQCLGAGFASNVTLSAQPLARGNRLVLSDIRVDRVEDEATRAVLELLGGAAATSLPGAIDIDIWSLLNNGLKEVKGNTLSLEQLQIRRVIVSQSAIGVDFDFRLRAR